MNLLALVPGVRWLPLAGAALLLAGIGVQTLRLDHAQRDVADVKAAWSADRAQAAERARAAEAAEREKERAWIAQQKERDDANELKMQALRADAAIADAAAGRLRERIAAYVAAARAGSANPAPEPISPPAADPLGMFANVLGQCVERVRRLAAIADERGAAGSACEQSYDAVAGK